MIRITCKQHNFRRCRVAHPKGTTDYPDDTFTPAQIKVLQAEPKLGVEIVPDEPEGTETETGTTVESPDGVPPGGGTSTGQGSGETVKGEQDERPDDAMPGEQISGDTLDGEKLEQVKKPGTKRKK